LFTAFVYYISFQFGNIDVIKASYKETFFRATSTRFKRSRTYEHPAVRYVSAVLYACMSARVLVIFKSGHLASPWLHIGEYSNITPWKDKYILRFYYHTHNPVFSSESSQQHLFYGDECRKNCSKWPISMILRSKREFVWTNTTSDVFQLLNNATACALIK